MSEVHPVAEEHSPHHILPSPEERIRAYRRILIGNLEREALQTPGRLRETDFWEEHGTMINFRDGQTTTVGRFLKRKVPVVQSVAACNFCRVFDHADFCGETLIVPIDFYLTSEGIIVNDGERTQLNEFTTDTLKTMLEKLKKLGR